MGIEAPKSILLVEDELLIATVEKKALEKLGYTVLIAASGESAIELFAANPAIDLVLMDIDLGEGLDGTQAAERILGLRHIPVVFLSSHTEASVVRKTENITSYGYVVKNSSDTVLDASIKMAFKLFDANERVAESEFRLARAEKVANIGNWKLILGSRRVVSSRGACHIYGVEAECMSLEEVGQIPLPEYRGMLDEALRGLVEEGIPYSMDFKIRRPSDGSLVDVHSHADYDERHGVVYGVIQDVTDRRNADERLQALLAEKESILKEVHHRIKNNMSTMTSLLAVQARSIKDPAASTALKDAETRLRSMGVLYDKLYRSENLRVMSAKDYLPSLVKEIVTVFPNGPEVRVDLRVEDFPLSVEIVPTLGIILNEILTNSMKYAFVDRDGGSILVTAAAGEGRATISVEDDGVGIPADFDIDDPASFGLMLVGSLTRQIRGRARIERGRGTRFVLEFEA